MNPEKIIYSINIEDAQNVAKEELDRELTQQELKVIENKIGDYLDWHNAISFAISENIENQELE